MTYKESGYTLEEALRAVGPGWEPLLRELWTHKSNGITVVQVKEKFGALRVYYNTAEHIDDTEFEAAVNAAEYQSMTMCEKCGKPGKITGKNWLLCLCEEHQKERVIN